MHQVETIALTENFTIGRFEAIQVYIHIDRSIVCQLWNQNEVKDLHDTMHEVNNSYKLASARKIAVLHMRSLFQLVHVCSTMCP